MASQESNLTFEQVLQYFRDNGGTVKNRDVVTSFKRYLTDPDTKDDARMKFKEYVNRLAVSKVVNGEKFLYLKTRYLQYQCPSSPLLSSPRVSQMPRAPLPPLDPMNSIESGTPQPPPRRKSSEKFRLNEDELASPTTPTGRGDLRKREALEETTEEVELRKKSNLDESKEEDAEENEANVSLSVKERTQKFNRLASVEGEERSPRTNKTPERSIKHQVSVFSSFHTVSVK
ncbi:hypothetical protein HHI36_018491 [Cryptolaemus montrouzieri]|uniref:SOWAHA-C winged helix-turn-helix domain-containing protein n=1 Tax=Cryptolaemus montrouzieri TaxID=559131 RepID=A0ABD2P085_9CUCU